MSCVTVSLLWTPVILRFPSGIRHFRWVNYETPLDKCEMSYVSSWDTSNFPKYIDNSNLKVLAPMINFF